MKMSHMMADTDEELHAMADAIGIARRHFQKGDHYDISITKRNLAIRNGAVEISMQQMAAYHFFFECYHFKVPPWIASIFEYGKDYPLSEETE